MERLSKVLKEIYTSGDKYTVLQLLNKFIKEVEKYEISEVTVPVYCHSCVVNGTGFQVLFNILTPKDSVTEDDYWNLVSQGRINASGYFYVEDILYQIVDIVDGKAHGINENNIYTFNWYSADHSFAITNTYLINGGDNQ